MEQEESVQSKANLRRQHVAVRTAWVTLGGLILGLSVLESSGSSFLIALCAIGFWATGLLLLSTSGLASRVESAWNAAVSATATRIALVALAGLGVLASYLFGVYGALLALTPVALGGLVLAAAGGHRMLRTCIVNGTLLCTAFVVALAAIEGVLRVSALAATLGTPAEVARSAQRYDRLWERNIFGFRSPHETFTRPANSLRLVVLGDSFTWGDGIASSDSLWPAQLERRLAARLSGQEVEVINLARNGLTTANEAEILRRVGWQFQPDAVIVQYYRNDVLPSGPNLERESVAYLTPRYRLLPLVMRQGRVTSLALLDLLEREYSRWRNRSPLDPWLALYEDDFVGWQQTEGALNEMGRSALERGVPIYLLLYPQLVPGGWEADSHPDRAIHEKVINTAQRACMRVIDLTPVLAHATERGRKWGWASPYNGHPNGEVNAIVAQELSDVLPADGLGSSGREDDHRGDREATTVACTAE